MINFTQVTQEMPVTVVTFNSFTKISITAKPFPTWKTLGYVSLIFSFLRSVSKKHSAFFRLFVFLVYLFIII